MKNKNGQVENQPSSDTAHASCQRTAGDAIYHYDLFSGEEELREDFPYRPVDWRYKRALRIVAGIDRHHPCGTDEDLESIIENLRKRQEALKTGRRPLLTGSREGFNQALFIYRRGGRAPWWLESLILATGLVDFPAQQMGMSRETVEAYEKIFFDVRNRLGQLDVMAEVGTWRHYRQAHNEKRDMGRIWKLFAYCGGPKALAALIAEDIAAGRPNSYDYLYEDRPNPSTRRPRLRRIQNAVRALLDKKSYLLPPDYYLVDGILKEEFWNGLDAEEEGMDDVYGIEDEEEVESGADNVGQSPGDDSPTIRAERDVS